jgi:hypothetical protein
MTGEAWKARECERAAEEEVVVVEVEEKRAEEEGKTERAEKAERRMAIPVIEQRQTPW